MIVMKRILIGTSIGFCPHARLGVMDVRQPIYDEINEIYDINETTE